MISDAIREALEPRRDQEDMRLITGFADVFAAVVLVGGLVVLLTLAGQFIGAASGLLGLVVVWLLTVPLVERRQFAACAILLSVAFAIGVGLPAFALLGSFGAPVVAVALYFYWQRFRIPLAAALGLTFAVAFPALLVLGFQGFMPWSHGDSALTDALLFHLGGYTALFVGAVLFVIAMRWDFSDRERKTRRSDVAFWLHLLAGPMTVHGLFSLIGIGRFDVNIINPWPVVALFALFTMTAVVIDRRPLLIASFGYFLYALGQIIYRQIGVAAGPEYIAIPQVVMLAALSGGMLVAVLAGAWSPLRNKVIALLPDTLAARVPPPTLGWTPPAPRDSDTAAGEGEPLRLVLGLNDYLATMGMGVLFVGSLVASYVIIAAQAQDAISSGGPEAAAGFAAIWGGATPWVALLVPFAIVCGAAEIFVRRQRMALTAMAASGQFALLALLAGSLFFWQQGAAPIFNEAMTGNRLTIDPMLPMGVIVFACVGAAALNWGFGWVNKIPASAGWGALMLVPLLFVDEVTKQPITSFGSGDLSADAVRFRLLAFGAALFVAALALDRSDPARRTQRSDVAFWLHLLASLFIVSIIFTAVRANFGQLVLPGAATMAVYAVLVLVALAINRRAPLVVGIPFVLMSVELADLTTRLMIQLGFFVALMALVLSWERVRARALAAVGRG